MPPRGRDAATLRQRRVAEAADDSADAEPSESTPELSRTSSSERLAELKYSSKVAFYPPSDRYWRIGGEWYDFENFDHPGGQHVLRIARDRFEDATYVFESHHMNYKRARAIIRKYRVPEMVVEPKKRPKKVELPGDAHTDSRLEADFVPELLPDTSFYSVFRKRVAAHLKSVGCPGGEPTAECVALFWVNVLLFHLSCFAMWSTGEWKYTFPCALTGAWLGAFGHNWVHQPRYYGMGWGLLTLDTVGFSSEAWYREHVLQHHMYTNTPWDNHFKGTDPFLKTDPTAERTWVQAYVMPALHPLVLIFGVYGNWSLHSYELLMGREHFSVGKFILPLQFYLMTSKWGLAHGFGLMFASHAMLSIYYFTIALMNHNAEHCHDVVERNKSKDWGVSQLHTSADFGLNSSFKQAILYLGLNFHGVHHLCPKVDFCHHPQIQQILAETAAEFGLTYHNEQTFMEVWWQMMRSFKTPKALFSEVFVYNGNL
mmetsp:Transcript_36372/g.74645  ORF Transcript_36372/g.74645 Transcript_36372/m.74645 type:complete len:485 (+) Transcript_36372:145-1599(+)